jgi:pyruvate kinase
MNIHRLEQNLYKILEEIIYLEGPIENETKEAHAGYRTSAKNLLRYLLFRSKDLRKYHGLLSDLGISSLRSAEGYVYSNLYNVVRNINLIRGTKIRINPGIELIGYTRSMELLRAHSNDLFGANRAKHYTHIMVTLPDEAAEDKNLVREMIDRGLEIARINLSHGDQEQWLKMVNIIKELRDETGKDIKIYMDLSGPKLRTAEIQRLSKKGSVKRNIKVAPGDLIRLCKKDVHTDANAREIRVLLDEVVNDAKLGDRLLFDDGMISSEVVAKDDQSITVKIRKCYKPKIGSEKGINLPDTKLNLPALTPKDLEALPFVCAHAEIVGYSFVRSGEDVKTLYRELEKLKAEHMGVVFKIENKEAFENLPEILLEGMKHYKIGVMIARGDLAVEIGFERISEVQNEILWLCEAAHVPVIWATQVLETLAKTGIPTRAEISDASQAAQAECVMLNKGPHIHQAIETLKNILKRMEGHTSKKKNELRALNVARETLEVLGLGEAHSTAVESETNP